MIKDFFFLLLMLLEILSFTTKDYTHSFLDIYPITIKTEDATIGFYKDSTVIKNDQEITYYYNLGDIDNSGKNDKIALWTLIDGYDIKWTLYLDDLPVFSKSSPYLCDFTASCLDLDNDSINEIYIQIFPHVNSIPLQEYVVLKQTENGWMELENTEDWESDKSYNDFPIDVIYGKEELTFEISVEGYSSIIVDVRDHYERILEKYSDDEEKSELYNVACKMLKTNEYSEGDDVGTDGGWGICYLGTGSFEGKDCIIASEEIYGPVYIQDYIGLLKIYFNYNNDGKINILNISFDQAE